jgi:glucan 1,3-beta-glucosidase
MEPSSTPPTGLTSSETLSLVDERALTPLRGPDLPFLQERNSVGSNFDSIPTGSPANSFFNPSSSLNPLGGVVLDVPDKLEPDFGATVPRSRSKRNNGFRFVFIIISALVLIILAVVLGVYFGVIRNKHTTTGSGGSPSSSSPDSGGSPSNSGSIIFGDGSVVTTENGSTFTYNNKFGGYFVVDPDNPFNNDARAQSWSPPLNQSWKFGSDQVLG